MTDSTIIYTHTDEAPALATYSLLPVIEAYASTAGVTVDSTRQHELQSWAARGGAEAEARGRAVEDKSNQRAGDAARVERVSHTSTCTRWHNRRASGSERSVRADSSRV